MQASTAKTYAKFVPASQMSTVIGEGGHRLPSFICFPSTGLLKKVLGSLLLILFYSNGCHQNQIPKCNLLFLCQVEFLFSTQPYIQLPWLQTKSLVCDRKICFRFNRENNKPLGHADGKTQTDVADNLCMLVLFKTHVLKMRVL